ncbi:MAG: DUF4230 domain-containing protein [Paraprevotella sp.]|jgi:hypothetical protein|uniref:DUF4230 domain-containing protein n=1 Tax=Paraprevotella sp. TaxID=2049036 RepID=UPI00257D8F80|nr:DUF4230 domain-containing protein [Paraprevotella sp.]MBS4808650.1 DUF4230 domain-containing protein [Paraprevotella sp.]
MKTTFYFVIVLCLSLLSACRGEETKAEAVRVDTLSLVMQVKECARLYTAEYEVHKLVLKDDPLRVKGNLFQRAFDVKVPIGERKVMIPLDVTLKAYIDFTGFDEKNVLRSGDRIVVTLPDPRVVVTSSRINHDEVKQFVSLTRSDYTSAELADFTRQGEDEILASVPQLGILEMARENAAHVLVPMLTRLGYDERNIVISFRKDFTTADMPLLLDREGRTEKLK